MLQVVHSLQMYRSSLCFYVLQVVHSLQMFVPQFIVLLYADRKVRPGNGMTTSGVGLTRMRLSSWYGSRFQVILSLVLGTRYMRRNKSSCHFQMKSHGCIPVTIATPGETDKQKKGEPLPVNRLSYRWQNSAVPQETAQPPTSEMYICVRFSHVCKLKCQLQCYTLWRSTGITKVFFTFRTP